jgi:hypothetical protein
LDKFFNAFNSLTLCSKELSNGVPFSVCFSVPTNKAKQKDDNPLGTVITLRSASLACTNSDMVLLKIGNFAIKTFAKDQIRDRQFKALRISKNLLCPFKKVIKNK